MILSAGAAQHKRFRRWPGIGPADEAPGPAQQGCRGMRWCLRKTADSGTFCTESPLLEGVLELRVRLRRYQVERLGLVVRVGVVVRRRHRLVDRRQEDRDAVVA